MIVDLASWAFFVAVPMIVPAEDSEPGTVLVVNKVFPAIRPNPLIPVPVDSFFGASTKQRRGRKRLGLDPEIFVAIADGAVRGETVEYASVLIIPSFGARRRESPTSPYRLQDDLCDVPGLEAALPIRSDFPKCPATPEVDLCDEHLSPMYWQRWPIVG